MNSTVKLAFSSIEKKEFDNFMRKYKDGKFGAQRLGQAFYNHFNLHKVNDQESLCNLYEKDGEQAANLIKTLFDFN